MNKVPLVVVKYMGDEWMWAWLICFVRLLESAVGVLTLGTVNLFIGSRIVQWRMTKVAGRLAESLSEETMRDILRRIGGE